MFLIPRSGGPSRRTYGLVGDAAHHQSTRRVRRRDRPGGRIHSAHSVWLWQEGGGRWNPCRRGRQLAFALQCALAHMALQSPGNLRLLPASRAGLPVSSPPLYPHLSPSDSCISHLKLVHHHTFMLGLPAACGLPMWFSRATRTQKSRCRSPEPCGTVIGTWQCWQSP